MSFFYKKIILSTIIISLVFSFTNNIVRAQSSQSNEIGIEVIPRTPRIGVPINARLYSDSIDLKSQNIVWYVNDKINRGGIGASEILIQNQSDLATKVRAVVTKSDGSKIEASTEIVPSEIDLIIEPLSYKTPFYKGKPYFIDQGTFYASVVPNIKINGKKIESKDIFYKWIKDNIVLGKSSGIGKDSIRITGSVPISDINLEVEAYDGLTNKLLAKDSKIITTDKPKILFFEKNPLYGTLYNKSISNEYYIGDRDELTILAEPFSFDFIKDIDDNSIYSWEINNNSATSSKNKNELLLVQQENKLKGTANISVDVSNNARDFQEANNNFNLDFGK